MRIARITLALLMLGYAAAARAADDVPQLMLDTGGHMANVKGLTFTPDGKQLVSAGDDKVIRIWDWAGGKTVRTIRAQVGPGNEGNIFALALSPDGRWLATGGYYNDDEVRLFDFASGKLVAQLKGHDNVVNVLAFSPDGKQLISGQNADIAAIIWDVERQRPIRQLKGHEAPVYGVAFSPDGERVVTASNDGTLRLWRVSDGELIAVMRGHKGDIDRALAVRASDGMIASGDASGEIRLWDGKTGQLLQTLANQGSSVGPLRFSPDGKQLLSVCEIRKCDGKYGGHVWDVATGNLIVTYAKHDNVVLAAAVSPDGRFGATAGGNNKEIHVWDLMTGERKQVLAGTGTSVWGVGVSSDQQRIAWGISSNYTAANDRGPLQLQLRLPGGGQGLARPDRIDEAAAKSFVRASATYESFLLAHREGGDPWRPDGVLDVRRDGRRLVSIERDSTNGFRHRSYTFTPDGRTIISGGASGRLSAYDLQGKHLDDFVGHESEVWAVTPFPDGRMLVTGSADQTIRLWNLATRELIVTLFRGHDDEWVMWTPQGYYASSPDGDRIVGWQINKGPENAADYVTASQLRHHFFRPDIVKRAIILASAKAAIAEARGTDFSLTELLKRQPPAFKIISPNDGSRASATPVEIRLQVEPNGDPVEAIEVLVNGRQATSSALRNATARYATLGISDRRVEVPLEQGENKIRIVARNKVGQTVREFVLFHDKPGTLDRRGTLYVLAIGVDKYKQLPPNCGEDRKQNCDLRFAGKDARAFRDVLVKRVGPLYSKVITLLVAEDGDRPPIKSNIEDALGEILGKAGPEDTTVLFIAGHGVNDGGGSDYLFLPADAEPTRDGWRNSTILKWVLLQDALHKTQGRRLMFADTCHSGGAYNARLVNDANNANIIVFSATDTQTLSWEFENLAHGAFTYALIQGLEGKARRGDGSISVLSLGDYVSGEVASLTTDRQQPSFHMSGAKNFMLARQ